jgi:2-oxoglutarate ferredoxin oxidoreductase subunit beta
VAVAAGATYVARTTSYHTGQMDMFIKDGINHKGFSVIDVIDACPTYYGRKNKMKSVIDMMEWQKSAVVPAKLAEKMKPAELEEKIVTGLLCRKTDQPDYGTVYETIRKKAGGTK